MFKYFSTCILLLLLPCMSYAATQDFSIGVSFGQTPLTIGRNAQPSFITSAITSDEELVFKTSIYRKSGFFSRNEIVNVSEIAFPASRWPTNKLTYNNNWEPPQPGTYWIKVEALNETGAVVASGESPKLAVTDIDFVAVWMKDLAKKSLKLDADASDDQFITALEDLYSGGHKLLFYFSADFDPSLGLLGLITGGASLNLGAGYFFDVMDYLAITEEGKNGWVSTYIHAFSSVDISPPTSLEWGMMPYQYNRAEEDAVDLFDVVEVGGVAKVQGAKLSVDEGLGGTDIDFMRSDSEYGYKLGYGLTVRTDSPGWELRRTNLDSLLVESLIPDSVGLESELLGVDWSNTVATLSPGAYLILRSLELVSRSAREAFDFQKNLKRLLENGSGVRPLTLNDSGSGAEQFTAKDLVLEQAGKAISSILLKEDEAKSLEFRVYRYGSGSDGNVERDVFLLASEPAGALTYQAGVLAWSSSSSVENATAIFSYKSAIAPVQVQRVSNAGEVQGVDKPNLFIRLKTALPSSAKGGEQFTLRAALESVRVPVEGARMAYSILDKGRPLVSNKKMKALGNGVYEIGITWPNVNASTVTLEIHASKSDYDPDEASYAFSLQKKAVIADKGPRLKRIKPDYSSVVGQRKRLKFKVEASTRFSELAGVHWYLDDGSSSRDNDCGRSNIDNIGDVVDSDKFKASGSSKGKESASITFDTLGENQIVCAEVYRDDGVSSTIKWVVDVVSSEQPTITPQLPVTQDASGNYLLPLGQTKFEVLVADSDDDTRRLSWLLDGAPYASDKLGGGNPASVESVRIDFTKAGFYSVKAVAADKRGNAASYEFNIVVGADDPTNTPPTCRIVSDSIVNTKALRVGYEYNFDYYGYDTDVEPEKQLAIAEVFLNGSQDFCWKDRSNPVEDDCTDDLDGQSDRVGISTMKNIRFPVAGDYTLQLFVRDKLGAECEDSIALTVLAADEGSSVSPQVLRILPPSGQIFRFSPPPR